MQLPVPGILRSKETPQMHNGGGVLCGGGSGMFDDFGNTMHHDAMVMDKTCCKRCKVGHLLMINLTEEIESRDNCHSSIKKSIDHVR